MSDRVIKFKETLSLLWWSTVQSLKVAPVLFVLENITQIIISVFFIFYSKLQGNLIDSFSKVHENIWVVLIPAIALLVFSVIRDIVGYLNWSLLSAVLGEKQERYYTRLFLHHYSKLDIGRIEQPEFQDLKNKVSDRALWQLRKLPSNISELIGRLIALLIGAGIIFAIHPIAAISVIVGTIPSFIVEMYYTKARTKIWDDLTTERRAFLSMKNSFESKKTIQELIISNRTKNFLDKIDTYLDREYTFNFGAEKRFIFPNILVKIIETLSIGGALYFIILQGFQGTLSVGEIVFSFGVLYSINTSLASMVKSISEINSSMPYLRNVKDYFDVKPLITQVEQPVKIEQNTDITVVFENVSFVYPDKEDFVLKNVSFTLAHGQKLALVGLNGAGKTTIIKLLLRMYDPTEGRILINGVDLKQIDLTTWYDKLGVLLQDFSRYEFLSIKDSIKLFAKQELDDEELHDLLKKVRADSITNEAEAGLNLIQSSEYGGKELSGGQFQKVAIARTLSRNAHFVILDEPTSAIDALSEESIFETLNSLPTDTTLLFISHRFTTIRNANHIIVINNGTVAEEGTHDVLMNNNKLYAQMYRSQVLGEK